MNEQTEPVDPQQEQAPPRQPPFDQALVEEFREQVNQAMIRHPELRSATVVFDFHGGLNDTGSLKGVWLSEEGPVRSFGAIFGSLHNTLQMAKVQMDRLGSVADNLRDETQAVGEELAKRRKALEDYDKSLKEKQQEHGRLTTALANLREEINAEAERRSRLDTTG